MWPILLALAALIAAAVFAWLWWRRGVELAGARRVGEETRATLEAARDEYRQARADAEARLQALFDSMGEGVLLLGDAGRVELVNDALRRWFGITLDVRGRTPLEALRLSEVQEAVGRVRDNQPVVNVALELPGVERRCVEMNAAAVRDSAGRPEGIILVFRDLTAAQQLETSRKEFVANVSHELRTPLSLIKGYVETLIDGARNDPAIGLRFLQTIAKHADRLTYLIEDLLTLSQLESGGIVLNLESVDLHTQAARVADDFADRLAERQIRLTNEVPPDLTARADADRLLQVLFNLVDNAIKYGEPNGEVTLGGRETETGELELWVHNSGPGIPADALHRVFERFYRADRARAREQGGTGLGLAIVRHIVQSHGGEVRVESEPGRGATFFFTLPRAEVAPRAVHAESSV